MRAAEQPPVGPEIERVAKAGRRWSRAITPRTWASVEAVTGSSALTYRLSGRLTVLVGRATLGALPPHQPGAGAA
jgi:hypothetical protein